MLGETLIRLVVIFVCVAVTQTLVRRQSHTLAPIATTLRMPPRLIETVVILILAVPAAYLVLYLLTLVGII